MTRQVSQAVCAAGTLLFCSCLYSEHPLAPPEEGVVDERLYGAWVVEESVLADASEELPDMYYFSPSAGIEENHLMVSLWVAQSDDGTLEVTPSSAWSVELGDQRYLCWAVSGAGFTPAEIMQQENETIYHLAARYEIHDDELLLYGNLSAQAERELSIPEPQPGVPQAPCTSSTEELQALAVDNQLFSDEPTFRMRRLQ